MTLRSAKLHCNTAVRFKWEGSPHRPIWRTPGTRESADHSAFLTLNRGLPRKWKTLDESAASANATTGVTGEDLRRLGPFVNQMMLRIFCLGVTAAIKAYPEFLGGVMAPPTRQELGVVPNAGWFPASTRPATFLVDSGYCCPVLRDPEDRQVRRQLGFKLDRVHRRRRCRHH